MKTKFIIASVLCSLAMMACGENKQAEVVRSQQASIAAVNSGNSKSDAVQQHKVRKRLPSLKYTCSNNDSIHVVSLLAEAFSLKQKPSDWVLWMAKKFTGIPYVGGTLDRTKEEMLIVNVHELDCTTYVEQALALAQCAANGEKSFADFITRLAHIRYIGGSVEYVKRQHYFTAWINDNVEEGIVTDIQGPNPPFTKVQNVSVNWMTTHKSSYKMLSAHPEWVDGIKALEASINGKSYRYIPKTIIANTKLMRQTIHDGDIIVIITNKKGLDTTHIGFASWHNDGLHLLNASSIHKKVIDEPMLLKTYMSKHPVQIGIRVCRPVL